MHRIPSPAFALAAAVLLFGSCSQPKAPDAAMQEIIQEVANGRASSIWYALPSSYQGDLRDVFISLADKLDPDVYDEGFAIARDFVKVARSKTDLIADIAPPQLSMLDLEEHGGMIFDLCEAFTTGQFTTVAGIRKLDPAVFLDRFGSTLIRAVGKAAEAKGQDLDEVLAGITVTVQSIDGNECVLLLSASTTPFTFPLRCELVEGKWIPSAMASGWKSAMDKIRAQIAKMPNMSDPATKKRMMSELAKGREQLAAFQRAETGEEFKRLSAGMPPK